MAPSVTGSGVAWGLYFMAYNGFKAQFRDADQGSKPRQLSPLQNLACAAEAGVLVTLLTNPIWVLKTRFQLQLGGGMKGTVKGKALGADRYAGMSSAAASIWRKEGKSRAAQDW